MQRQFKKPCAKIAQTITPHSAAKKTQDWKPALGAEFKTWHV